MRLKLKERHLGREQRRTKLIWIKCGGKTQKTETLMKFSGQTGPAMPRKWRGGEEQGTGVFKKKPWYCLLMLLLFTPQRMVWWDGDERETEERVIHPYSLEGGGDGSAQRPLTQQEMSRYIQYMQHFSHLTSLRSTFQGDFTVHLL